MNPIFDSRNMNDDELVTLPLTVEADELSLWSIPDDLFDIDETAKPSLGDLYKRSNAKVVPVEKTVNRLSTGDLLHRMCAGMGTDCRLRALLTALEHTISVDPSALERQHAMKDYCYPLHIALSNRATPREVLQLLINEAAAYRDSDVMLLEDGPTQCLPIHLLIERTSSDTILVKAALTASPKSVEKVDKEGNTPLHIACRCAAPLRTVRLLYRLYVEAAEMRNTDGKTPLELAKDPSLVSFLESRSEESPSQEEV